MDQIHKRATAELLALRLFDRIQPTFAVRYCSLTWLTG